MKRIRSIIWGVAIMALAVILGGNALGLFNINVFFDGWWTLFFIIPSTISLITEKPKIPSLVILAVGVVLLLAAQNVFSYDIAWKLILAAIFLVIGIKIIIKGFFHGKDDKEVEEKVHEMEKDEKVDAQMAVFSSNDRIYKGEEFSGTNILAVFGAAELDLRNAKITKDTAIKAFCLFGGIDILVPENINVKVKSGFIFGGVSDEREANSKKEKFTIYLEAAGGFSGVNIGDKKHKK